jgi:hypothetical protein
LKAKELKARELKAKELKNEAAKENSDSPHGFVFIFPVVMMEPPACSLLITLDL